MSVRSCEHVSEDERTDGQAGRKPGGHEGSQAGRLVDRQTSMQAVTRQDVDR